MATSGEEELRLHSPKRKLRWGQRGPAFVSFRRVMNTKRSPQFFLFFSFFIVGNFDISNNSKQSICL